MPNARIVLLGSKKLGKKYKNKQHYHIMQYAHYIASFSVVTLSCAAVHMYMHIAHATQVLDVKIKILKV